MLSRAGRGGDHAQRVLQRRHRLVRGPIDPAGSKAIKQEGDAPVGLDESDNTQKACGWRE